MSKLFTIFTREILRLFSARSDEPRTAAEADVSGPWKVLPLPDGFHGLFRCGEAADEDLPVVAFKLREDALLAAAALPATGREPLYRLRPEGKPHGFDIEVEGEVVGRCLLFNQDLVAYLHALATVHRSPAAMAYFLEGCSGLTLHHAGKILLERMQQGPQS
jgi:hypothetical protein